jgi:outer membrane protein assembly factor BamB
MQVAGPMLFAVMLRGGPHLVGYRLMDGAQRWTVPLTVGGADAQVGPIDVIDGAVLVSMHSSLTVLRTVAVDAATGRELWHSDLPQVLGVGVGAGSTVVLGAYLNPDGSPGGAPYPGTDGPPQPLLLHGVQARTGRLVWAQQVPLGWRAVLPLAEAGTQPAIGFVIVAPDGHAATVNLATGGVQASGTIDAVPTSQSDNPASLVELYGDQLLLVTTRQGRPTLAAYRVATLDQQWTATLPTTDVFLSRCGPWLCASYLNATHAIIAGTGAPAWTITNSPQDMGWLAGWIYVGADPTHPDTAALIDPVTQRVALHLGQWRISTPTTGPVLLTSAAGPNDTLLGLLADGPRIEILGVVTARLQDGCQAGDGHLACLTINDQLRIFEYKP